MHKGYHNTNFKGNSAPSIKGGLTVQELKQMTALRMAQSQEYAHHMPGPPLRNDMVYASAASLPPPPRFAPSLEINPRPDVRHENRYMFSDDFRHDSFSDKRNSPSFQKHHNHPMQFASQPLPNHNHAVPVPVHHGNIPRANYQSPSRSGPPLLSKSPARRMKSPSTVPTPTTPVTPTTPTDVPHAITVQELKELTRRRLAREAGADGRQGGGSTAHSREGSVCSADELSLTADIMDKSSLSGGSGGTDREMDTFSELLLSSLSLKPTDNPSPRISPLHMMQQLPPYPPLHSTALPLASVPLSSGNGQVPRLSSDPTGPTAPNPAAMGIHPGLNESFGGSSRPFTRERERDTDVNQSNAGLRKLALNNANREVTISEEAMLASFRQQSPPASPRSLRNRPKLSVSYPEPLGRMRSSSSDFGSSIPIEAAESVLLTPTPCSPSTPRQQLSKYPLDHRYQQRKESIDRKDSFDLEVALTRASIGLGANDQPLGLLHGLPVLRADDIGHGTARPEEAWYGGRRGPALFQDNADQFAAPMARAPIGMRSQSGYSVPNGVLDTENPAPVTMGTRAFGQSASVSPSSDVDMELAALDDNGRRDDVVGLEPTIPLKTQSFSPIFLYDTSGPFSYSPDPITATMANGNTSPMASFEQDLAPLLASALLGPEAEIGSSSTSTSRLNSYQQGTSRSRLFP